MSGEKHHVRAHRRQSGLSLIELMISLALAALFLLGIVVLFQQSKSSALQDEQIARMQENGRYALRVLSRELAMMNYFGGMIDVDTSEPLQFESKLDNEDGCNADWLLEIDTPLEFSDKDDSTDSVDDPDYTCINENTEIVDGTDVLAIKRVGDYAAREYDAGITGVAAGFVFTDGMEPIDGGAALSRLRLARCLGRHFLRFDTLQDLAPTTSVPHDGSHGGECAEVHLRRGLPGAVTAEAIRFQERSNGLRELDIERGRCVLLALDQGGKRCCREDEVQAPRTRREWDQHPHCLLPDLIV